MCNVFRFDAIHCYRNYIKRRHSENVAPRVIEKQLEKREHRIYTPEALIVCLYFLDSLIWNEIITITAQYDGKSSTESNIFVRTNVCELGRCVL